MFHRTLRLLLATLALLLAFPSAAAAAPRLDPPAPVEDDLQGFLDGLPGPLKSYRDGDSSAAEQIGNVSSYYGVSPRVLLALLEATGGLLSSPTVSDATLRQPIGAAGPTGFSAQIDWAGRELRAGLGPYERPPTVQFTDGTTLTLSLEQAPEGVAVQRLLAKGRTQPEWRAVFDRFLQAFQNYFNNELPAERKPQPAATNGFLDRPWAAGTRVVHLSYFDHMFPTVDTGGNDNGYVVNYLGRGGMQYDGHDGHDFYFPDQPIGTYILAAADGVAYARTHRGNGVVIIHPGGYETVYWHLDKFAKIFKGRVDTNQGVPIKAGDLLGSSGKTGFTSGTPHLHFEVRHNGKQVDPYGWYGPDADPCARYAACEASAWLWRSDLAGEFDFTPPGTAVAEADRTPPAVNLAVNPRPDLLFLAEFEDSLLQQRGAGTPAYDGTPGFRDAAFGRGVRVGSNDRLALPVDGNLRLDAGSITVWADLPDEYPANTTSRNYLLAASAHPDEGPVYTGTLALRRESGPDGARWTFWTTPESGEIGRSDLSVPDTLAPGTHQFTLTWDRAAGAKALFIDGALAASAEGVELPESVGELLELGRWSPGHGLGGMTIDRLAIYSRALGAEEVGKLVADPKTLRAAVQRVYAPQISIDINAADESGGIMAMQLGVNGVFGDPQPYEDSYELGLPDASGEYTIAVRVFDRAGNSSEASTTVSLGAPPWPSATITAQGELAATLAFTVTEAMTGTEQVPIEAQISTTPNLDGAAWRPLPGRVILSWTDGSRAVWVRFRDEAGTLSPPLALGPDANRAWLPLANR